MAWDDRQEQRYQELLKRRAEREAAATAPEQNQGFLSDVGTALKVGAARLPGDVAGLADVVNPLTRLPGGERFSAVKSADVLAGMTGISPQRYAEETAQREYSPAQQQFRQELSAAEGFGPTLGVLGRNLGQAAVMGVESLPGMVAGGGLGRLGLRGLQAAGVVGAAPSAAARIAAGAAGEGALMGGAQTRELIDEGVDVGAAADAGLITGAAGGAIAALGGGLARRMGLADVDTLLAGGGRALAEGVAPAGRTLTQRALGLTGRVAGGAVSEGVFEEAPQSALETIIGNVAAGREWDEEVGKNVAIGGVVGGLYGGAINIPGARRMVDATQPAAREPAPEGGDLFGGAAPQEQPAPAPLTELRKQHAEAARRAEAAATPQEAAEFSAQADALFEQISGREAEQESLRSRHSELVQLARQSADNPDLLAQLAPEITAVRQQMKEAGLSEATASPERAQKRVDALNKQIEKFSQQIEEAIETNPEKAVEVSRRLATARTELQQLNDYLAPAAPTGQLGLFDETAAAPQAAPAEDPALTALRTSTEDVFTKSGQLKKHVADFYTRWRDAPATDIAAGLADLEAAKGGKWRIAVLEALQTTRQQEAADVATEMDATRDQGQRAVDGGGAGLAPVRTELDAGAGVAAGEAAPSGGAGVPVGVAPGEQPAGVVDRALAPGGVFSQETAAAAPTAQAAAAAPAARAPGRVEERVLGRPAKLAPRQQQVFDFLSERVRTGNMDDIVDAEGVMKYADIGQALGLARGSVKAAVDGTIRRIASSQGVSVAEFKEALRTRAATQRRVEPAAETQLGMSPSEQATVLDEREVFGEETPFGVIGTVGGSQTETGEDVLATALAVQRPDPVAAQRAAEAEGRRLQELQNIRDILSEADAVLAEINWDSAVEDRRNRLRAPKFAELHIADKVEFTVISREFESGNIDEDTLVAEIRGMIPTLEKTDGASERAQEFARVLPSGEAGPVVGQRRIESRAEPGEADAARRAEAAVEGRGAAAEPAVREEVVQAAELNPVEQRVEQLRALNLGERQQLRLDRLVQRYREGDIDLERLGEELQMLEEQAFPEDRGGRGMRFSAVEGGRRGTTVEAIQQAIQSIATPAGRGKITIVQSADELVQRGVLRASESRGTQGYVTRDGRAFFVADNIRPGNELAVVLHEIGAHLGIENILTDTQYESLVRKIFNWAQSDADTQETRIARAAIRRVAQANIINEADLSPEVIAYFVEEAVKAGVDPTARNLRSELGRWLNTLMNALKAALKKLNLINADTLTAQDVVDLAYGAANLELRSETTTETEARFSRAEPTATPEGFFDTLRTGFSNLMTNPVGAMKSHGLGWLTLEQLADVVKSDAVRRYQRVMVAIQQFSKDRVAEASRIDVEWSGLSQNEQARLSAVMREATRSEFDPESVEPKTDAQNALSAQFAALTPAAKRVYVKVRDYYAKGFEDRKKILMDAANRAKAAGKNTAVVDRLFAGIKGPYFPLMRLGKWYSVGMSDELSALMQKREDGTASKAELARIDAMRKDATHYVARGHNSRAEAKRSEAELKARLGVSYSGLAEERVREEVSSMPDLASVENYIAADLPADVRGQVKDMMVQMYFDMLPEKSALKRQMKREGIHGEEEDMRRVFAASSLSMAHHISRLKYANDLSEAMVNVRKEARGGNETMQMVRNELVKRTALSLDLSQNPLIDRVLQVSYFSHLGLSPAFILTNMTQVPMITAPWLGSRHGYSKTVGALAQAFADTKDMIRSTYAGKSFKDSWRSELDWSNKFRAGSNEDRLMRELLDRNLLDITMEHDLGAVAEARHSVLDKPIRALTGGTAQGLDEVVKLANLPVRVTELANRAITGLAAYRLAIADGRTHEQAVDHAAKALSETQLDYSGLNTARHMQVVLGSRPLARVMMQFRKYQQGMIYLVAKNAYDAASAKGLTEAETKELRRVARHTLYGLFGTTGLMAGAVGLPFAGSLAAVANAMASAGGEDDEPFDAEVSFRNFLTDMVGPEMAAALAKGLPTLLGLDLSKRVGLGDIGSPLPFFRQGQTGTETVTTAIGTAVGGASVSTFAGIYDGIQFLAQGDYAKGLEKVVPLKMAQNLIRGHRYSDEGLTNRNGELIVPAEKFDSWDIAFRASGFQPMRESEYYAASEAVEGARRAVTTVRNRLLREYAQARMRGEPTTDVDAEIRAFNERHPQRGLRIDSSSKLRAVQSRRRMAAERSEVGVRMDRTAETFAERARFAAP